MLLLLCDGNKIFEDFKGTDHMYELSLPSEIFCVKPAFVACSYAVSCSGPVQATKTALILNNSLHRQRI